MAIDYCHAHDLEWNRDDYTECPCCVMQGHSRVAPLEMRAPVPISDKPTDLIRRLMDGYPFQAKDKELHDECKRVLGEA